LRFTVRRSFGPAGLAAALASFLIKGTQEAEKAQQNEAQEVKNG